MTFQDFSRLSRRRFLSTAGAGRHQRRLAGALSQPRCRPADRQSGVQFRRRRRRWRVVWARADRPSQMLVEVATSESFANARAAAGSRRCRKRLHGQMLLENMPSGAANLLPHPVPRSLGYQYRERAGCRALPHPRLAIARDVSFVWGGDVAGQGWASTQTTAACFTFPPCASIAQIFCALRRHGLADDYQERG